MPIITSSHEGFSFFSGAFSVVFNRLFSNCISQQGNSLNLCPLLGDI